LEEHGLDETIKQLEVLWIDIENIKQLILLCKDGFYKRNIVDLDTAESVMESLSVLIERLSVKVDDMVNEMECINALDRNQ
jgi:hypothetical protein